MKRNLIIILISIVVLAAGFFLLTKKDIVFTNKETSKIKAIPIDAPFFIEFNSLKDFPLNEEIIAGFYQSGFLKPIINLTSKVDSLILNSEAINQSSRNEPFIVALNLEGRETVSPLIIIDAGSAKKGKVLEDLLIQLFPRSDYQFNKRDYAGEKIFYSDKNGKTFVYSFAEGLFLASPKPTIVEKAIRQLVSESLTENNVFLKAHKTATMQAQASVYINHKYFPQLIRGVISPQSINTTNEFGENVKINYRNKIEGFSDFSSWSEFDLNAKGNELQLNGVSIAPDSLNQFLTVFKRQEPVRMKADKVLPVNTAMFYSLGFSNSDNFYEDLDLYFRHSDVYYSREEKRKNIEAAVRADLKKVFEDITEDEVALAFINVPADPQNKSKCFVISGKGRSQNEEILLAWLKQHALRKGIEFSQLSSIYEIDQETKFEVFKFPYPSFPGIWLGSPFYSADANFLAFWDNYIIFSDTRNTLENILHSLTLDATLANDENYNKFRQKTENRANINLFIDINKSFFLYKEFFTENTGEIFKGGEESIRKFGLLNWQLSNTDNIYFNNINLSYPEKAEEDAKTIWQSNIGTNIDFKPQLIVNHNDPGNNEIIVQDEKNMLHLINSEGRVRWSIEISEKILGEIHQVDLYRNGKLQFLFNTKSKLYVIDRNGNNVSPFPLALRSPASNGVNVFDYDNNQKYRFFVAGEDKKIYVYDNEGKIISGWKFGQTDHEVSTPVQHFRVNNKDYIVFKDKSKIYVQDRQGRTRVNVGVSFENSQNPIILDSKGQGKMVTTDSEGNVYYLYFNGEFKKIETPGFSNNHFFNASDINGNNSLEFIFADNDELTVLNEQGKKVFSKKINKEISYQPNIYTFSSSLKKVGIVSRDENRIYLYNPDGSLHKGFPLIGNSEFSIGKILEGSSSFNLIVGSNGGNIYNYSLD